MLSRAETLATGISLTAMFALGACTTGSAVTERLVPSPNCSVDADETVRMTFNGIAIGERVLVGHPRSHDQGVKVDATITVTPDGQLSAETHLRDDIEPTPDIATVIA